MSEKTQRLLTWEYLMAASNSVEFLMRLDPEVHKLITLNPAFYLHLFSHEVRWNALVPSGWLAKRMQTAKVRQTYTVTTFDLHKYTGLASVPINTEEDVFVCPNTYFWEVHVDTTRMHRKIFIQKIRRVEEELKTFASIYRTLDHTRHSRMSTQLYTQTKDALFVGSISHLGRLVELLAPEYCWDASTTLPRVLLSLYAKRMQMVVDSSNGTRIVAPEDMRSVIVPQHLYGPNKRV